MYNWKLGKKNHATVNEIIKTAEGENKHKLQYPPSETKEKIEITVEVLEETEKDETLF